MKKGKSHAKAFSIIEIILASGLFALFTVAVFYISLDTLERDVQNDLRREALSYAQEGMEAIKLLQSSDYNSLDNGSYGLSFDNPNWTLTVEPEILDNFFTRTVTLSDVYRDANGDVSETGTLDPNARSVSVEVEWNWKGLLNKSVKLDTQITNWKSSEWILASCTDFAEGDFDYVESAVVGDPVENDCSIELSVSPSGDDLDYEGEINTWTHGIDTVIEGDVLYMAMHSSQYGLAAFDISNPDDVTLLGVVDVGGWAEHITVQNSIVYVGMRLKNDGLSIVDASDPTAMQLLSQTDVGEIGTQLELSGTSLFMGTENQDGGFVSLDVSDPENPVILATLDVGGDVDSLDVSGDYAYIGIDQSTNSFKVIDISDPSNPVERGSLDFGYELNTVLASGTYVYTSITDWFDAFKVINIADPDNPYLVSETNLDTDIVDMVIVDQTIYAALQRVQYELARIDVSNPSSPIVEQMSFSNGQPTSISTNGDYLFVSVDQWNQGGMTVQINEGGISPVGTYTSETLDTGSDSPQYNYLEWTGELPAGTGLELQIRTSSSSSNIGSATWVGPDGSSSSYYNASRTPIVLDPDRSGARYLQVQATLTSDGVENLSLEDITINFNP